MRHQPAPQRSKMSNYKSQREKKFLSTRQARYFLTLSIPTIFIFFFLAAYTSNNHPLPPPTILPNIKSQWLPGEHVHFVLQHEVNTSFFFIEDDPNQGIDPIRGYLLQAEGGVRSLFHHLLHIPGCKEKEESDRFGNSCETSHTTKKRIVVDIGANRGYYSLMAASYGHTVYSFDPQPHCDVMILAEVVMNELQHLVHHRRAFVSNEMVQMEVQKRTGCVGTFPNGGDWGEAFRRPLDHMQGANETVLVDTVRLDDMFDGELVEVLLMKMDVEGHECYVMESGRRLIESGAVRNIVMEFNMRMLAEQGKDVKLMRKKAFNMVEKLLGLGYRSKAGFRGDWNKQSVMTLEEWKNVIVDDEQFLSGDGWFYK